MGIFSFLGFGSGTIKNALRKGAIIVDVRTGIEYDRGHLPDAFNIPADRILASAGRLKAANRPIIVCSNNDPRSHTAVQQLKAKGVKNVINGGDWKNVLRIMEQMG
jgi:phage shock protein E